MFQHGQRKCTYSSMKKLIAGGNLIQNKTEHFLRHLYIRKSNDRDAEWLKELRGEQIE